MEGGPPAGGGKGGAIFSEKGGWGRLRENLVRGRKGGKKSENRQIIQEKGVIHQFSY